MAVLKKVAALLSILVAVVILFFAYSGSFSQNNTAIRRPQYTHRAPPGETAATSTSKIKDFAVDRTIDQPSRWISRGKHEFKGAPNLTKDVIDGIKKFVFFIGYPRSGHSIVGSLMDAHPHMVIANEFLLFRNWKFFSDKQKESGEANPFYQHKSYLFNILYRRSYWDTVDGFRSEQNTVKNYTLSMDSLWQGKFDKYISVIGDKSGGVTSDTYLNSKTTFSRYLEELKTTVKVPIKAVHVVRNPYDQISTCALYDDYTHLPGYIKMALRDDTQKVLKRRLKLATVSKYKAAMTALQAKGDNRTFAAAKYSDEDTLENCINTLAAEASAVTKMTGLVGSSNVIEVHNAELVNDPKAAIEKLCSSLEVVCAPDYLQACANKVFKSVSRTRDMLHWSPRMKAKVEEDVIQTYPFFNRYSFESE